MSNYSNELVAAIAEMRRLRTLSVESECDFLEYLTQVELNESLWRGMPGAWTGFKSFEELVHKENVCEYHRVANYKNAVSELGVSIVRQIGAHAAFAAMRMPTDVRSMRDPSMSVRQAVLIEAQNSVARNSVPPSERSAKQYVKAHMPKLAPVVRHADLVSELKQANAALEVENRKLRAALMRAEKELATLRGAAASASVIRKTRAPLASKNAERLDSLNDPSTPVSA